MISQFVKQNKAAAIIVTILRVYLGYTWFEAGLHKVMGGFDASGFLHGAIAKPVTGPTGDVVYGWFVSFLRHIALPNAHIINYVVPYGELLVGLGLILGCITTWAAVFALVMNFSYMFAGTISSNPMDVLLAVIIIAAGMNAKRIGLDRFIK